MAPLVRLRSLSKCFDGGRWLGDRDVGGGGEFLRTEVSTFITGTNPKSARAFESQTVSIHPSQLSRPMDYSRSSMRTALSHGSAVGGHATVRLNLRSRSSGGHRKIVHHGSRFPYLSLCSHNVFICRRQVGR